MNWKSTIEIKPMHNLMPESVIFTEQTIFDNLPVAIVIVDRHGIIYYRNPQADEIFRKKFSYLADFTKVSSAFDKQAFIRAIDNFDNNPSKPFNLKINFDHLKLPGFYQLKMIVYPEVNYPQNRRFYFISLVAIDKEPSAHKKSSASKEPSAHKKSSANKEPSAHKEPSASKESPQYALLKKNFKELKQFSRLNAMREISSSLADQLNQPLTAILTYTQAMQRLYHNNASSEEISGAMERVVINAENAGQIIRNIRARLKTNTLNCQSVSINQLIQQSIHLSELDNPASHINLITHFDPLSTQLCVDSIQIKQVMLSLLNNATDALVNSRIEEPEIVLTTGVNDLCYQITIKDNGPGIPGEIQDQLFEPFNTTKEDGIGIGLSMCHHIIELHKGSISVFSRHGSDGQTDNKATGTEVIICLPMQAR
ncbi:MAG: ATP-binding protein [Gammaproteobacteria bacterium]|nr:ATP-binding protein [Gammaproteobacteria bacterium]